MSTPTATTLVIFAALALSTLFPSTSARAEGPEFRIVVHPRNPSDGVSRHFLTEAFLKKTSRWDDGEALRPVDLRPDAGTRKRFSESVLKRSVAAIRSYWAQRIFSGRGVPPPELDSDDAVLSFVLKHRGAVGYVSGAANTGKVKVLPIH
jgi:hypothetical protein